MQESKVKFKDPITGSEMNVEPIKWRISLETSQLLSISICTRTQYTVDK